jgi:two-component system phosphate regulon sensor histidine kinase PhoR
VLSTAAQGRFAAEFATFLVAAAGLSVVGLRPDLLSRAAWARVTMAIGFMAVGTASFLQGSGIVADRSSVATALVMGAGLVGVAAGLLRWAGGAPARRLMLFGLVFMLLSIALDLRSVTAGDAVLGIGAVLAGVALLEASRRSVAARVAASAAGTLLAVVLVLSVSLSAVLATTFDRDQGRQLVARAATETRLVEDAGSSTALLIARTASLIISASPVGATEIRNLAANPNPQVDPQLSETVLGSIRRTLFPQVSLVYVNQKGQVLGLSLVGNLDQSILTRVVGSAPVQQAIGHGAITHDSERGSVAVANTTAVAVGVEPVAITDAQTLQNVYPGVILAVEPLDTSYLTTRTSDDKDQTTLVLATRDAILASSGPSVDRATALHLAADALDGVAPVNGQRRGGDFYAASTVVASDQTPVMALIAAKPTTVVSQTRDNLFRTLFEIALGGTLLALLLAAAVGERIGAGLRTLTEAAQRIQRGELGVERTNVRTDDEVGVLGAAFDSMAESISEQTAALQKAAQDETALRNQLEAVVAGMGEALVAVDAEGRITLLNRAAEELLEVDATTAVGQWVDDVIVATAEDGTSLPARLRKPSPTRWSTQITLIPEQGPGVPVGLTSGALRSPSGGVAGAVFVLRDLRPEREVERMKSEFLSRIGHELRTPLTAILGYADILRRRKVTEAKAREFHDEIFESGQRLSRIVQMLEFSAAAEAGRSLMRPEVTSVRAIVDSVVSEWGARVNGNLRITRRVARGLPELTADRRWLALSLNELVDNAVKFSPEGGKINVLATPSTTHDGEPAVEIAVVDQGVGMTEADVDRVFGDFAQADSSDTRRFGGLGLGLSLVKRVAEAHGGTVTVESTARKGSKFSIVLPV